MKKRIISMILALTMVLSLAPVTAFAAECGHHTEHTADCGYAEGVSECAYVCADCAANAGDVSPVTEDTEEPVEEPGEEPVEEPVEEPAEEPAAVTEEVTSPAPDGGTLPKGEGDAFPSGEGGTATAVTEEVVEPDAVEPDAVEPDAAEPDAAEPDAVEPDAAEPDPEPEDNTTPAQITGVTVTVDGVEYTSGHVTITPDTRSIVFNITGTNFANLSTNNRLAYAQGLYIYVSPDDGSVDIDAEAGTATATFDISNGPASFIYCNNFEVKYSNDGDSTKIGTGIYLTYNDGTTPARITGVSVTVDGVTVDSTTGGSLTIAPDSTVVFTVTGAVFANLSETNHLYHAYAYFTPVAPGYGFTIDTQAGTATVEFRGNYIEIFESCSNFEVQYSNDGGSNTFGTGIYLTYDENATAPEADPVALSLGDNAIRLDIPYTYTAEQDGTLNITVTELYYGTSGIAHEGDLNRWCAIAINGTNITAFANSVEVTAGDTVTVKLMSLDNDTYHGTINLAWDDGTAEPEDTTSARITGVSVTVDGVTVDSTTGGSLTITPTSTVVFTVEGVNFANLSEANFLYEAYASSTEVTSDYGFAIDAQAGTATKDYSNRISWFENCSNYEVQYSNDSGNNWTGTGIYLTYDDGTAEPEPIALSLGDNAIQQNITYTYTAGQDGTLNITVTELYYGAGNVVHESKLGSWCAIAINGTNITAFANTVEVTAGDTVTVKLMNLDGDTYYGTINLTWDDGIVEPETFAITQQPVDAEAKLGETYCVEVIATGEGLQYQWYFRNEGSTLWNKSSVKDSTYDDEMTMARAGREVYCVITDANGNTLTSDHAFLIAVPGEELAIVQQPNDASAKLNEEFCVTVEAQGDDLKYTWYWRNAGTEAWNPSSQRDNTYDATMTSARHNREVKCVITDAWGNSVETETALITGEATVQLAITRQPESQTVKLGDWFNVTFDAVGDGLKYQWYFMNQGDENWYTSAQKDNSYDDVMTKPRHSRSLYCVVTDAWGNTVTTEPIVVITATQREELAILTQPADTSAKLDEEFCVTVEAQGDEVKYKWYWRNVGTETWNPSGQRDNTYDAVMTKARHNREVKCVITDMWGNTLETEVAVITATPNEALAIVTQPADAYAAMGENFCVTVEAAGDGLTYTWYFKNAGTNVWHKSGVTDNTYDDEMIASRADREVYCVITDLWGNTVTTDTVCIHRVN